MRYESFGNLDKCIQGYMLMAALDEAILSAGDAMCWLDFGTLLGCARTGTFYKNDYDVDISVMAGWWPPEMDKYMQKRGFEPIGSSLVHPRVVSKYLLQQPLEPCQYAYFYRGIHLSVWVYFDGNGVAFEGPSKVCFGWQGREPYETPANLLDSFVLREFPDGGGVEFYVPEQATAYLEYMYGDRWNKDDMWELSIIDKEFLSKTITKGSTLNYQHCIAEHKDTDA